MKKEGHNPRVISKYGDIVTILYYIARYLSLFLLIGLCIISTLYAVGNLVTIQAENFTCPRYTEEQVRRTNFDKRYETGQTNTCFYIDRQVLDFNAIYNLDISIYNASFGDNIDIFDAILFVFYLFIALISIILTIYHAYYLLYDSYYFIRGKCTNHNPTTATHDNSNKVHTTHKINPRFKKIVEECSKNYHRSKAKQKRQRSTKNHKQKKNTQVKYQSSLQKCLHGFSDAINIYTHFISDYVYFDSKYWLIGIILREFFEIIIQFYALLLYGGVNLFDKNENVLSQEGHIVEGMNHPSEKTKIGCVCDVFDDFDCFCYFYSFRNHCWL